MIYVEGLFEHSIIITKERFYIFDRNWNRLGFVDTYIALTYCHISYCQEKISLHSTCLYRMSCVAAVVIYQA